MMAVQKKNRIFAWLLVMFMVATIGILLPDRVLADGNGGAGEGLDPTGGSCGGYWDTCRGITWQKYLVTAINGLPTEADKDKNGGAHFAYQDSTGGPVNLYGCAYGQTIYNYGYETGPSASKGQHYQVATVKNKDFTQYKWWDLPANEVGREGRGAYPGTLKLNSGAKTTSTIISYVVPLGYAKSGVWRGGSSCDKNYPEDEHDTVQYHYCKMKEYDASHGTNYASGTEWDTVGWFCFDPGAIDDTPKPHAVKSTVTSSNKTATTGIISVSNEATIELEVNKGDSITVSFAHDAYSEIQNETISPIVQRGDGILNPNGYSISGSTRYASVNLSNKKAQFADSGNWYSIAASNSHAHTDTYTISFGRVGDFIICDSIALDDITAESCVRVKVKDNTPPQTTTCATHAPASYSGSGIDKGTTSSWSAVSSNVFVGEYQEIWAKPNDQISFVHCYFPGAQAVRITSWDSAHELTSDQRNTLANWGNLNNNPPLTKSFTDTIGDRDKAATADDGIGNHFTVNTSISSSATSTPAFSLEALSANAPFSPASTSGLSVTFTGSTGLVGGAKVSTSNTLKIAASGVGTTISQGVHPNVNVLEANAKHSSWTKNNDWPYSYYYDETFNNQVLWTTRGECRVAIRSLTSRTGSNRGDWFNLNYGACNCTVLGDEPDDSDTCSITYNYKTHATGTGYTNGTYTVTHKNSRGENATFYGRKSVSYYSGNASTAYVRIPYNYSNTSTITIGTDKIYAGETFNVGAGVVTVSQRYNGTTQGTYATKTPTTTAKLYVFHSANDLSSKSAGTTSGNGSCSYYGSIGGEECREVSSTNRQLNTSGNWDGSTETGFFDGRSINAYDIPAGNYICIGLSIWPYTTNGNTDMGNSGNNQAYYSKPACQKVYKKPSFQVWGGGVYSNGNMSAAIANKNNLSGYVSYQTSGGATNTFGSWVEQAIVSNGSISGIASGAATGYTTNNKGILSFNPGGIAGGSSVNCLQAPLTIPNTDYCRNSSSMKSGIKTTGNAIYTKIYDTVVSGKKFKDVNGSSINLDSTANYAQDGLTRGTRLASGSHVSGGTLKHNFTHIIYSTGDIYIDGDLVYENFKYTSAVEVPQYIIYSGASVNIKCSVKTINALIVATNGLNTCYDGGDETDTKRNNQLTVNGIVIAKSLDLGRTYGAGIGNKSGIPAEIFNLSLTTRFFGKESSTEKPTLYTVYLRELSPRY